MSKERQWIEPAKHCQNGGDVCLAGNADGICCPDDSCDIDDGMTLRDPRRKDPPPPGERGCCICGKQACRGHQPTAK